MKVYGNVNLSEGSELKNLTVAKGTTFPESPNSGEIFFHNTFGLTFHDGLKWNSVSTDIHVLNDTFTIEYVSGKVDKIVPSSGFKPRSTQLYVSGARMMLGTDYQEIDNYIKLNFQLSQAEIETGSNIVLDFIKANI